MRFKKVLNVNQMATFRGYEFKAARTANLKNGLTVGEKRACPVKSTGHASLIFSFTSIKTEWLYYFLFIYYFSYK